MAGKFNVYNELVRAQLENISSDPSATATGLCYFNTTSLQPKFYTGSVWRSMMPLTTKGDIFTHSATDSARLAVGPDGYALVADSSQTTGIKWAPISVTNTINTVTGNNYTITDGDGYRAVFISNGGATDYTVTLPSAASNSGRIITVKKMDTGTGNITVAGNIDGDTGGAILDIVYEHVTVISNGTAWFII